MRLLPVLLVGASALFLSACDDHKPRKAPAPRAQAAADCCCKDLCPTPAKAPVVGTPEEEGIVARREGGQARRVSHERRGGYRHRVRTGTEGVGYLDEEAHGYRRVRSGTEGVGYLDEDLDDAYRGGYRRVGASVSVEERETFEESARYSESGYRYSTGGGYVAYEGRDGYGGGHRKHGRRGGGGYAGVDRDGYLTWPGKTE